MAFLGREFVSTQLLSICCAELNSQRDPSDEAQTNLCEMTFYSINSGVINKKRRDQNEISLGLDFIEQQIFITSLLKYFLPDLIHDITFCRTRLGDEGDMKLESRIDALGSLW